MSVNLICAIDQRKVARFGKYFGSIDFNVATTNRQLVDRRGKSVRVGELLIGGRRCGLTLQELEDLIIDIGSTGECHLDGYTWDDLTKHELDRIVETLKTAKYVFFQKYRLGI